MLRTLVGELDDERIEAVLGYHAPIVSGLMPELAGRSRNFTTRPETADPEQVRFLQFDAITSIIRRASEEKPVLLILEDLHWADTASIRLLEFAATSIDESHVMVLGMYRDVDPSSDHPLTEALGGIGTGRLFHRIALGGLDTEGVSELVAAVTGTPPGGQLLRDIEDRTAGNPFFVSEIASDLADSGGESQSRSVNSRPNGFRVPVGVREAIGRRLRRLPESTNDALIVAAVLGREFRASHLEILLGDAADQNLLDQLEGAVSTSLIEEIPDAVGLYRFTHALIQETLIARLSATRRARVHARVATKMESFHGDNADENAAELARHFAEGESVLGTAKLIHYSRTAGERALESGGVEQAVVHFDRAFAARGDDAIDNEIADLRFGRGRANLALRKFEEAVPDLTAAFEYYETTGGNRDAVSVARLPSVSVEIADALLSVRERALKLVAPGSLDEGHILLQMAQSTERGIEVVLESVDRALQIAQDRGNHSLEFQALWMALLAQTFAIRGARPNPEYLARAVDLTETVNDPLTESGVRFIAGNDLAMGGNPQEAFKQYEAGIAAAQRSGYRERISTVCFMAGDLASNLGEWDRAREFLGRSQQAWADDARAIARRALVELEVGEVTEGKSYVTRLQKLRESYGSKSEAMAYPGAAPQLTATLPHAIRITDLDEFRTIARSAAEEVLSAGSLTTIEFDAKRALAEVLAQAGDMADAERFYDEIADVPDRDRELAWTAAAVGRADDALARFETVIESTRNAGYRPWLAWACGGAAEVLLGRAGPGDREMAFGLLDEALAITREIGMRPLEARLAELSDRAPVRRGGRTTYAAGLTEREVEVLVLVASGLTNGAIAQALTISPNTVVRHVQNIFAKTGAANRAEAAAFATRTGLAGEDPQFDSGESGHE